MLPELCPVPVKVMEMELRLMYYFPVTPRPALKLVDLVSETELAISIFFVGGESKKLSMGQNHW